MSQFKTTTSTLTNLSSKNHPHDLKQVSTITTNQITPQTFTNTGFMRFSRPTKQ
jgi:hypothetical protein